MLPSLITTSTSIIKGIVPFNNPIVDLYSKQIEGIISNEIFNAIYAIGLKIPDPTLQRVVSRVAEEVAVLVNGTISSGANNYLTTIPAQRVGYTNPFNLVSNNLGIADITGDMFNILNKQYSSQINNVIINMIEGELRKLLPPDVGGIVSFANIITVFSNLISPSIEQAISIALGGFSTGLFNRSVGTAPLIPSTTNFFGLFSSEQALIRIDERYNRVMTDRYLGFSEKYDIHNPGNEAKLVTLEKGFIDPTGNFPRQEYSKSGDVNFLATGNVPNTIVQKKNDSRMIGAKLPGDDSWEQPVSPYNAQYPFNKVTETESGHVIEVDDTPGSERLHIYHKSGTFIEIDSNGSIVKRAVGSSYEIIDRNGKISIEGRADISVNGACNIYIGQDANIEVNGDTNLTCHNDINAQAGGKMNLSATEEINITSNKINIQSYTDTNIRSTENTNIQSIRETNLKSTRSTNIQSSDEINIKSSSDTNIQSSDEINIRASGDIMITSDGDIHNLSIGDFFIGSINTHISAADSIFVTPLTNLNLRCGNEYRLDAIEYFTDDNKSIPASPASSGGGAGSASESGLSNVGIMSGRKDIVKTELDDPIPTNIIDQYSIMVEEDSISDDEFNTHRDNLILSGIVSSSDFAISPLVVETDDINSTQSMFIAGKDELKNYRFLPGNFNLSPNFTLEMLSSKAAVSKYMIQSNEISYGEIVFNLQQVALNILEPIYNIYPKMIITSGYRPRGRSTSTSQHPLGQAVDIQFRGISKNEYYDIARKIVGVLNYDQFLLEYSNYSNNPWIHISFVGSNNRKQVATFWNNRKHSSGLSKLV